MNKEIAPVRSIYQADRDHPLRTAQICGTASAALGYVLLANGYPVERCRTELSPNLYPTPDHSLLRINWPEPVVVDAAYQQFLKVLDISPVRLSKQEILVVPLSEIDSKLQEFARLHAYANSSGLHLRRVHGGMVFTKQLVLPPELGKTYRQQLAEYFEPVWDIRRDEFLCGGTDELQNSLLAFIDGERSELSPKQAKILDALFAHGMLSS